MINLNQLQSTANHKQPSTTTINNKQQQQKNKKNIKQHTTTNNNNVNIFQVFFDSFDITCLH